jgi:MFS family permease
MAELPAAAAAAPPAAEVEPRPGSVGQVCRLAEARLLLASSFFFCLGFLWLQFVAAWTVQRQTGSTRLVQLSGSCCLAPMALGPLAGALADRTSRKFFEAGVLGAILLCSAAIAAAALLRWPYDLLGPEVGGEDGPARTAWLAMIYAHMAVVGAGMPVYFTTHMPLLNEAVKHHGPELLGIAMAMCICNFGLAGILGNQLGGLVVDLFGPAVAYAVGAGWYLVALALLLCVPVPARARATPAGIHARLVLTEEGAAAPPAAGQPAKATTMDLLRNREFLGVLTVTVIGNLTFWGHIPFIQVLAARLGASPTAAGLLASATGYGALAGASIVALARPNRIGTLFVGGMTAASALLALTAVENYWVLLAALLAANLCGGFFGATQSTLALRAVPATQQGLAMGLLSLSIGAQAAGMLLIGQAAAELGPGRAMLLFAGLGVGLQVASWLLVPEVTRMVAVPPAGVGGGAVQ